MTYRTAVRCAKHISRLTNPKGDGYRRQDDQHGHQHVPPGQPGGQWAMPRPEVRQARRREPEYFPAASS